GDHGRCGEYRLRPGQRRWPAGRLLLRPHHTGDRHHPGLPRRIPHPGLVLAASVAGAGDHHHIVGHRDLQGVAQGRALALTPQRQVDHLGPLPHRPHHALGHGGRTLVPVLVVQYAYRQNGGLRGEAHRHLRPPPGDQRGHGGAVTHHVHPPIGRAVHVVPPG